MRFLNLAALSLLMATPAHANGCKFVSAYTLVCSTAEGSVSMYFNGERWTPPRYRYPRYYRYHH